VLWGADPRFDDRRMNPGNFPSPERSGHADMQSRVQGDERSARRGPVFAGDDELYVIAMLQHEENQTKPVKGNSGPAVIGN
jgi:hypothetical protein